MIQTSGVAMGGKVPPPHLFWDSCYYDDVINDIKRFSTKDKNICIFKKIKLNDQISKFSLIGLFWQSCPENHKMCVLYVL